MAGVSQGIRQVGELRLQQGLSTRVELFRKSAGGIITMLDDGFPDLPGIDEVVPPTLTIVCESAKPGARHFPV